MIIYIDMSKQGAAQRFALLVGGEMYFTNTTTIFAQFYFRTRSPPANPVHAVLGVCILICLTKTLPSPQNLKAIASAV
jgi:hypothetical protein